MAAQTPNYSFNLPAVGSPTDEDIWGDELNANWSDLDTTLKTVSDVANEAALAKVPTGTILMYGGSVAPAQFSECDHGELDRTTNAALFAVIGTAFGAGNGTTTFNKPDMRGSFARGWDHGRGVDPARALGSFQDDAFEAHAHTTDYGNYTGSGPFISGNAAGVSSQSTSSSTGATETRPKNIALMFIIKL